MIDFLAIARRCLQPLANRGFTFWDEHRCRGEVRLECERGDIQILVCYEPVGPPWCDLFRAGRYERRLEVAPKPDSDSTLRFFETHEQEVEAWCLRLLKVLEDEKIAA